MRLIEEWSRVERSDPKLVFCLRAQELSHARYGIFYADPEPADSATPI
jgi:hypothetical protein